MKFMKYLFAFALAVVFCSTASVSHAQTVQYLGTGSSALFLELGQAAAGLSDTGCYWTQKSTSAIAARDDRPTIPAGETDENGSIVIAWGPGTGTCAAPVAPFNIYSNMNLDSVLGDRCFFMVNAADQGGCIQIITIAAGTAGNPGGTSLLGSAFNDTPIPGNVISALNGQRIFVAATDVRPEDAKFASARMFTACGAPIVRNPYINTSYQTSGLGYQTATTGVGTPIQSFTNPGVVFHVHDFNISGNDPISGQPLAGAGRSPYTVTTVGAQPMMIVVSPVPASPTGIAAATDIMGQTLSEFFNGTYGRATDIFGPTSPNAVTTLIREPLSGTYNTFEYSNPNSNQFKSSQEASNCSGAVVKSNPMNLSSANGKVPGARRIRAVGTGEVVAALQAAATDTIGYFFWSAANASNFTPTNGKYLTVNGVDPILPSYNSNPVAPGVLPTGANLSAVTFQNLNAGDYSIWSALRLVSVSPTPAGVTNLVAGAQTLSSTQNDFIPLSKLKVWHSHFNLFAIGVTNNTNGNTVNPATPGDLCSLATSLTEAGGDAGAANISIHGNNDFCNDFNVPIGINDKNN
ncbi:MAG TPA: hypothetical protein VEU11_11825 [Terriglobales bacterium]|nr:hypothetical protein [Terriglobales bacterium]